MSHPLQNLLDDTISLSLKTQLFHWNVVGPHFSSLHTLFSHQYTALTTAIDLIAERLRALDHLISPYAPPPDSAISDPPSKSPKFTKMLEILGVENEKLAAFCASAARLTSEEDPATSNLFAERQDAHERAAWMLRSHLN